MRCRELSLRTKQDLTPTVHIHKEVERLTKRLFLSLFCIGFFCMSCAAEVMEIPTGKFVRAIGNQIHIMDFEKKSNEIIYEFPVGVIIEEKIYQIDSDTLLFSLPDEGKILSIDLNSKSIKYLGKGDAPVYMPEHEKILFYGKDKNGKGALLIADKNLSNVKSITRSGRYDPAKIVVVSSDEVVFQKGFRDSKVKELWKFNIASNELSKFSDKDDCRLVNVWRRATGQLICQKITADRFDTYYYLLGPDGIEQPLNFEGYLNAGTYLDDMDSIIIQKVRVSFLIEHSDLWVYRFSDGFSYKIMSDAGFAVDSMLRLEN